MRVTLDQLDSWCLHCSHLTRYQRSRFLARRAADHCAAVVGRSLTQLFAEAELQAVRARLEAMDSDNDGLLSELELLAALAALAPDGGEAGDAAQTVAELLEQAAGTTSAAARAAEGAEAQQHGAAPSELPEVDGVAEGVVAIDEVMAAVISRSLAARRDALVNCWARLGPDGEGTVPAAALRKVLGAEAGLVLLGAAARDFPGGGAGRRVSKADLAARLREAGATFGGSTLGGVG